MAPSAFPQSSYYIYHPTVRILIDQAIPGGAEAFAPYGACETFAGRAPDRDALARADALIVRSVTRVDAELLDATPIRFVATATSGIDHIDTACLEQRRIAFADAAGCNARAVADYVLAALYELAVRLGFDPRDRTIGVVGCGRVGSLVADLCKRQGMAVVQNDPPLARRGGGGYVDLPDLLDRCDILTLHVPLTDAGPDATRGLIAANQLHRLKTGAIVLHAARGGVVDEAALRAAVDSRGLHAAVDVWCNEPNIDAALVGRAALATPHLAGYSIESKRRATAMVAAAFATWTAQAGKSSPPRLEDANRSGGPAQESQEPHQPRESPEARATALTLDAPAGHAVADVAAALRQAAPLARADAELRAAAAAGNLSDAFDRIRLAHAGRHEFTALRVTGAAGHLPDTLARLAAMDLRASETLIR